jgi:phosphatidylglycerol---prolipoprotein diacylglyceryl transferase
MTFPVFIHLGPLVIHPHLLFETLAYFVGFRVYLYTRDKGRIPTEKAMWIVVGATIGAALGAKVVYWMEDPLTTLHHLTDYTYLMNGKTISGGLLGGLIGVEITKKRIGWTRRTGDDFALPLIVGMCIGRIGCFLTGLSDHTYGTPTTLFTGVDFGDGIPRHPTQLYEIAYLLMVVPVLLVMKKRCAAEGRVFQVFMLAYFVFRLLVDFIKPTLHPYLGLNNVQVVSLLAILYYAKLLLKRNDNQDKTVDTTAEEKGELQNA